MTDQTIEIKLGDILEGISEANRNLVRDVIKTVLDMGTKVRINLKGTEIYVGDYRLSLSGELKFETKLSKEERGK